MSGPFADAELAAAMSRPSPVGEPDVAAMRKQGAERAKARLRGPEMHEVREVRIGELGVRLYRPQAGPGPLLVYLHGGGWTIGSVDTHDRACRRLADRSGAAVPSLNYRLAPEHRWPASVDDTVTALRWVAEAPAELGTPPTAIAVGGDSAGGTLAALGCLRLRDEASPASPDLQVLICANTDLAGSYPSMREKADGFGLTADGVRFFSSQWVPDERRWSDPGVSPLRAPDLSRLPPALVITAEHDVLRDEGEAYASRLTEAGVAVRSRREPGLVHGFLLVDDVSPACAAAVDRLARDLRLLLSGDR